MEFPSYNMWTRLLLVLSKGTQDSADAGSPPTGATANPLTTHTPIFLITPL